MNSDPEKDPALGQVGRRAGLTSVIAFALPSISLGQVITSVPNGGSSLLLNLRLAIVA